MAIYIDANSLIGSSDFDRVAVEIVARQNKQTIRIPALVTRTELKRA